MIFLLMYREKKTESLILMLQLVAKTTKINAMLVNRSNEHQYVFQH